MQQSQQPQRIHQLLQAAPIALAGKVIQPVAQLDGWWGGGQNGEGGWARLTPASLTVREGERSYEVPMTDPTASIIRTFVLVGGAVALVSLLIMLFTTALTRRR